MQSKVNDPSRIGLDSPHRLHLDDILAGQVQECSLQDLGRKRNQVGYRRRHGPDEIRSRGVAWSRSALTSGRRPPRTWTSSRAVSHSHSTPSSYNIRHANTATSPRSVDDQTQSPGAISQKPRNGQGSFMTGAVLHSTLQRNESAVFKGQFAN